MAAWRSEEGQGNAVFAAGGERGLPWAGGCVSGSIGGRSAPEARGSSPAPPALQRATGTPCSPVLITLGSLQKGQPHLSLAGGGGQGA